MTVDAETRDRFEVATRDLIDMANEVRRSLNAAVEDPKVPVPIPAKYRHAPDDYVPLNKPRTVAKPKRTTTASVPAAAPPVVDGNLGKGERAVLRVIAQWPDGRTHNELAFLAGYSAKASTLGVILGKSASSAASVTSKRDSPSG